MKSNSVRRRAPRYITSDHSCYCQLLLELVYDALLRLRIAILSTFSCGALPYCLPRQQLSAMGYLC
jgi:hypothetical protein